MASKFVGVFGLLAVMTGAMAGVATYAHTPYAAYHVPAAAATVYHSQPLTYHATSPYFARSLVAAAPAAVHSYAAPIVKSYAAAPVAAVSPVVRTYAAAPVATYSAAPVAAVKSSVVPAPLVAAPVITKAAVVAPTVLKSVEFDSSPRYDFSYGVHDSITGDIKNQVESRNGGNVAGSYSVVDADGYKRTVTYTADDLNGFNAVVQREPLVRVAAPVVSAAVATPVQHVPVQQEIQYLPAQQQISTIQQQQIQQEYLPQIPAVPAQHQPASEPVPVEYPEQQQQPGQQEYPQDQQYPPFSQFENPQQAGSSNGDDDASDDDSEVIELRSASNNAQSASSATPAPVVENQKDSIPPKRTA